MSGYWLQDLITADNDWITNHNGSADDSQEITVDSRLINVHTQDPVTISASPFIRDFFQPERYSMDNSLGLMATKDKHLAKELIFQEAFNLPWTFLSRFFGFKIWPKDIDWPKDKLCWHFPFLC